jgi:hypothetical protein
VGRLSGQAEGSKIMSNKWNDYRYCDDFSFLDAAFLWLELDSNHEQTRNPPVAVKGLKDKMEKFVKSKRWEKLLSLQEDKEGFIFEEVLNLRNEKKVSIAPYVPRKTVPSDDLDPKRPCSDVERQELFTQMPPGSSKDSVSKEELQCFADSLEEKPKFLFPEMRDDSIKNLEDKVHPKKRNSYLKLIKGLLQKQGIDPIERGNIKILIGIVESAGQTLEKDAIGDILREVGDLS